MKSSREPRPRLLLVLRLLALGLLSLCLLSSAALQPRIDSAWASLRTWPPFQSVYFETIYTVLAYTLLLLPVSALERHPKLFRRFKIDPNAAFHHPSWGSMLRDSITYVTPLGLLDTFMVKWYAGVPEDEVLAKRASLVQTTRALPLGAPSLIEILRDLALSFLIYDLLFFLVHLSLHKQAWLYAKVHASHHSHPGGLHGRVTNQLSVAERVVLVLSANQALKVVGAHPLTRTAFVPLFLWLLIENHCNYDFPYSYDKLVPWGLCGGSPYHHAHHCRGSANYQPFFTHLDALYQRWRARGTRELQPAKSHHKAA